MVTSVSPAMVVVTIVAGCPATCDPTRSVSGPGPGKMGTWNRPSGPVTDLSPPQSDMLILPLYPSTATAKPQPVLTNVLGTGCPSASSTNTVSLRTGSVKLTTLSAST